MLVYICLEMARIGVSGTEYQRRAVLFVHVFICECVYINGYILTASRGAILYYLLFYCQSYHSILVLFVDVGQSLPICLYGLHATGICVCKFIFALYRLRNSIPSIPLTLHGIVLNR